MPSRRAHAFSQAAAGLAVTIVSPLAGGSRAAELVVGVNGLSDLVGKVGRSLFADANDFPMDNAGARLVWLAAGAKEVAVDIKVAK